MLLSEGQVLLDLAEVHAPIKMVVGGLAGGVLDVLGGRGLVPEYKVQIKYKLPPGCGLQVTGQSAARPDSRLA